MNARFEDIWVYLSATPLLGLTVTLIAYQIAYRKGSTDQEIGAIYYREILKTIELTPAKRSPSRRD